jgi:hypothetical protein
MNSKIAWVEGSEYSIDWVFAWPHPILSFWIPDNAGGGVSPRIVLSPDVRFDVLIEQLKSKHIMLVWTDDGTMTPKISRVLAINKL